MRRKEQSPPSIRVSTSRLVTVERVSWLRERKQSFVIEGVGFPDGKLFKRISQ
jgi:hypothetical protein